MGRFFKWRFLIRLRRNPIATDLFGDILYETTRVRSLPSTLTFFSERLCQALQLDSLHIFLRDGNRFTLRNPDATPVLGAYAFPSSSSTILRMKRDYYPTVFNRERPDAWQLLAPAKETDVFASLGTKLLVPLTGRTALTGFASLSRGSGPPAFSLAERRFLKNLGAELGHSIEISIFVEHLSEEAVRRAYITRQLELAAEVQQRLLPESLPSIAGLDVAATYSSAEQIGGDYYDVFATSSGLFCAVIADVSGHGYPPLC